MKSSVPKIGLGFVIAFAIVCVGFLIHDAYFVWPVEACEAQGHWWDDQDHLCAVPVPIAAVLGHGPHAPAAAVKPAVKAATRQSPTKR